MVAGSCGASWKRRELAANRRSGRSAGADRYPQGSLPPTHPPPPIPSSHFHRKGWETAGWGGKRKGEEGGEAPLSTTDTGTNEAPSVALKMKEAGSEVDSLGWASAPEAGKKKVMQRRLHRTCVCLAVRNYRACATANGQRGKGGGGYTST